MAVIIENKAKKLKTVEKNRKIDKENQCKGDREEESKREKGREMTRDLRQRQRKDRTGRSM